MIDTITIVFQDELETLKTQARSLEVYVENPGTIFVVVNENANSGLTSKIDRAWWGGLQERVQIISREEFGHVWTDNGWVSQQALKLLTSTISNNEWSIILDTKTFFVNPMPALESKPAIGELDIYSVFEPSQQIVNKLFGIDLVKQLGPGGVPFIINNAQCREMIDWIQVKTQQPFAEWFQQQGMLTEFILYSGWIQYKFGNFEKIYNTTNSNIFPCNLCHSEVASFDRIFKTMSEATTVSIHRRAWPQLTTLQQTQYIDFLASRGIQ
tara:strand:+ start:374 stop:1180 length:807 start_codon:yes stop_codon:yes gene_type:complete